MLKGFLLKPETKPTLHKHIDAIDLTAGYFSVDIRPYKSKRSLDQNSRYWKLITEAGAHFGYEADEFHQLMGYKFLRYAKNRREFIKSTTKLNTAEMADYQDKIERFCSQHGFVFDEQV